MPITSNRGPLSLLALLLAAGAAPASADAPANPEYASHFGILGRPTNSAVVYRRDGYAGAYCGDPADTSAKRLIYPIDAPGGFTIDHIRVSGVDQSATHDLNLKFFKVCQPFLAAGTPDIQLIGSGHSAGTDGTFSVLVGTSSQPVMPETCAYYVQAELSAADTACVGPDLVVREVRVHMRDPDLIFKDSFES